MGTLIEEIISRRAAHTVNAGEILLLDVDTIMSHDNTTPLAIKAFREIGKPILDKNRIVIHLDHDRGYVKPEMIERNRAIRAETRRTQATWTEHGLVRGTKASAVQ